jgi:hypothetical protein
MENPTFRLLRMSRIGDNIPLKSFFFDSKSILICVLDRESNNQKKRQGFFGIGIAGSAINQKFIDVPLKLGHIAVIRVCE